MNIIIPSVSPVVVRISQAIDNTYYDINTVKLYIKDVIPSSLQLFYKKEDMVS